MIPIKKVKTVFNLFNRYHTQVQCLIKNTTLANNPRNIYNAFYLDYVGYNKICLYNIFGRYINLLSLSSHHQNNKSYSA